MRRRREPMMGRRMGAFLALCRPLLTDVAIPMPRAGSGALVASRVLPASVMLAAALSPFELAIPGSIAGFTLTSVELAIVVALMLGAAAWWRDPAAFTLRTPITLPLVALAA